MCLCACARVCVTVRHREAAKKRECEAVREENLERTAKAIRQRGWGVSGGGGGGRGEKPTQQKKKNRKKRQSRLEEREERKRGEGALKCDVSAASLRVVVPKGPKGMR